MVSGKKPNIILITIDSLRPDYLGCYGSSYNTSPNIDKLAKDSVVFKKCYSPFYGTDPVHTTILTGLWPETHGIIHHGPRVNKREIVKFTIKIKAENRTLPQILNKLGYRTLAIDWLGRWYRQLFIYYSGLLKNKARDKVESYYRFLIQKLPFPSQVFYSLFKALPLDINVHAYDSAKSVINHAIRLIRNVKEPFFLFIHLWDTHTPYDPPLRYTKRFRYIKTKYNIRVEDLLNRIPDKNFKEYMKLCTYGARYTDEIIQRYLGAISYIDDELGQLMNFLKQTGLYDNSLIIIASDHGELLGEHGIYFDHHAHFEEVLRCVLIIKFPYSEYAGTVVRNSKACLVDITPTILEYLNIKIGFGFDGISIKSLIEMDNHGGISREIFFGIDAEEISGVRRGIIADEWKYSMSFTPIRPCKRCGIVHHFAEELFNIEKDPCETINLVNEEQMIAKKLRSRILKYYRGNI